MVEESEVPVAEVLAEKPPETRIKEFTTVAIRRSDIQKLNELLNAYSRKIGRPITKIEFLSVLISNFKVDDDASV